MGDKVMRFKIIITCAAMLIAFIVIFNCSGEKSVNEPAITHEEIRGDCLNYSFSPPGANYGYMVLEVHGNDLHICHNEAYYQCCLGYVVDYDIDEFDILATESDSAGQCHCDCFFDLRSILYDLESGMYTVTLTGIEGDIVGIDSAYVGE
jgi:hypothetical protein